MMGHGPRAGCSTSTVEIDSGSYGRCATGRVVRIHGGNWPGQLGDGRSAAEPATRFSSPSSASVSYMPLYHPWLSPASWSSLASTSLSLAFHSYRPSSRTSRLCVWVHLRALPPDPTNSAILRVLPHYSCDFAVVQEPWKRRQC